MFGIGHIRATHRTTDRSWTPTVLPAVNIPYQIFNPRTGTWGLHYPKGDTFRSKLPTLGPALGACTIHRVVHHNILTQYCYKTQSTCQPPISVSMFIYIRAILQYHASKSISTHFISFRINKFNFQIIQFRFRNFNSTIHIYKSFFYK